MFSRKFKSLLVYTSGKATASIYQNTNYDWVYYNGQTVPDAEQDWATNYPTSSGKLVNIIQNSLKLQNSDNNNGGYLNCISNAGS